MNYDELHNQLTDAFIDYQYRLDQPMPSPTETKAIRIEKYRNDFIFHNKVASLVSAIIHIVQKVEDSSDEKR